MDLRWWPVTITGLIALAGCVLLAMLLPMARERRQLRPLAHVDRLTKLPAYRRVARLRAASSAVTLVLLAILFASGVVISARPIGLFSANQAFAAAHPEDIMLCAGAPVTEPATGAMLAYFADQTRSFDTQRIGLTSENARVVPLTRDYATAAGRFADYADLSALQAERDADEPLSRAEADALRSGIAAFSRPVSYADYAPDTADLLALCLTGFPQFDQLASRRRSLIYVGPSEIRSADDPRPSLLTAERLRDLVERAGVQVNVITTDELAPTAPLRSIVTATDGQVAQFTPADGPPMSELLDRIRAHPPEVVLPGGGTVTARAYDSPDIPLIVAVAAAALLSATLLVLRR